MAQPRNRNSSAGLLTWIAIVMVIAVLYAAREVLIPLTVALLLSFMLGPLVIRVQRIGLGRVFSVLLVTAFSFLAIGLLGWLLAGQVVDLAESLPHYRSNIRQKVAGWRDSQGGMFGRAQRSIQTITDEVTRTAASQPEAPITQPVENSTATNKTPAAQTESAADLVTVQIVEQAPNPLESMWTTLTPLFSPLISAGIVIIFVVFMLIQREDLRERLIRLIGQGRLTVTTKALDDAATRVSTYLLMLMVTNAAFGLSVGIGLFLIGLPNALLWGVSASLLRFIPYAGPWIGAVLPVALALAISDNWLQPLLTMGLFVVLEIVVSNFIEPWLYGSKTGLTPVAVLVAALFWGWLWGPLGLMLAMPLTLCLLVIGRHVPRLEFLTLLLGNQPSLPIESRIYQRLLALDQDSVFEFADEFLKEKPLLEFYDQALLAVLNMAERDRHRGALDAEQDAFIDSSLRDLIENLGERARQAAKIETDNANAAVAPAEKSVLKQAAPPRSLNGLVMCLPASGATDEIASLMLAQLLELEGTGARVISVSALAGEALELIEESKPDVICISAMPPLAVTHARYLCKRISARFTDLPLVVGLWRTAEVEKARERIRTSGSERIATSFAQAIEQLRR